MARYRGETAERRGKVAWFLGALALGFAPLIIAVIATPFVPSLRDEQVRSRVGLVVDLLRSARSCRRRPTPWP